MDGNSVSDLIELEDTHEHDEISQRGGSRRRKKGEAFLLLGSGQMLYNFYLLPFYFEQREEGVDQDQGTFCKKLKTKTILWKTLFMYISL